MKIQSWQSTANRFFCFAITSATFCLTAGALFVGLTRAENLYVDAVAAPNGDGSSARPYWRITDAVLRARGDRRNAVIPAKERITIYVAAGTYYGSYDAQKLGANPQWEMLPIILNVPNLTLSGATVLDADAQGLPAGVHAGLETILATKDSHLVDALHALIVIAGTTDGSAGDGVTVNGFDLQQKQGGSSDPIRTFGLWVERVSDFEIRGNVFVQTPIGLGTRLASGVVQGNFFNASELGLIITGGSIVQPAVVTIAGNRAIGQSEGGLILSGVAGLASLALGANTVTLPLLQKTFDRRDPQDRRNIPDTLSAIVTGNEVSDNGHFGARLWGYTPSKYSTTDGTLTSVLNATLTGNSFLRNGDYGIAVDAGWADRSFPLTLSTAFTGTFQGNLFSANGRGPALFTFTTFWVSVGLNFPKYDKFQNQSFYQITDLDAELTGFDYDNPTTDPFDGTTLSNTLIVNGTVIPPGSKITSLKP